MSTWQPIATAPKEMRIWISDGDNAVAVFWHPQFEAFVSSFSRMTLARGMKFSATGLNYNDHSPVIHEGKWWMPRILPPEAAP